MAIAVLLAAFVTSAATAGGTQYNQPDQYNVRRQLDRRAGVIWSQMPLRDAIAHLADSHDVAIWLDRRVDPGQRISQVASDVRLADILARVAKDQDLGICLFDSVVYLGPREKVAQLRTLGELRRQEARELPGRAARRFARPRAMQWDELATPRDLLTDLAQSNGLKISNPELVVHDLWPAMRLRPMSLVDRLTLLLAPLDLTFEFEAAGRRIRLVPIPERVVLTRRHPAGPRPDEIVERWRRLAPDAQIRLVGDEIVVDALLEDHERLAKSDRSVTSGAPAGKRPKKTGLDRLRIERVKFKDQPLAAVVRHLAKQLKLELVFDADGLRQSGVDVDQRISLEMTDVGVDELFRAVLRPAGLTFRRDGSTLEIHASRH